MSQSEISKATAAEVRSEQTRSFVSTVKAATLRKYSPEEKIRIVLEGFRREETVNDLCRREGIKHILAAPYHPQTNGKLERYHQTLKWDVNQVPYEMPSDLEEAVAAFVSYYNHRRYHKALGNLTPADVIDGRRKRILQRRREAKAQTIERRRLHNPTLRVLTQPSPHT